jgi:hypothetical protein
MFLPCDTFYCLIQKSKPTIFPDPCILFLLILDFACLVPDLSYNLDEQLIILTSHQLFCNNYHRVRLQCGKLVFSLKLLAVLFLLRVIVCE